MIGKLYKQVIICPCRKREVEVIYTVSGDRLAPEYKVVACPAMYDDGVVCGRQCHSLLPLPSNYGDCIGTSADIPVTNQNVTIPPSEE